VSFDITAASKSANISSIAISSCCVYTTIASIKH